MIYTCYQCEEKTEWLAPDSRCGDCTRFTPEEIQGNTGNPPRPKFLLLGHAQHGKDTVAQLMQLHWGITWQSSSVAALEIFMFDILKDLLGYETLREAYEDRHDHRLLWKELITAYNYKDRARLCRDILSRNGNDMYVGMRCPLEYEASKHLFDKIFWVDAGQRKPLDPSMSIEFDSGSMLVIPNNLDLSTLDSFIKGDLFGGLVGGRR